VNITSVNNELVKNYAKLLKKKYRNENEKFILEGFKTIKEAYDYHIEIEALFVEKSHLKDFSFYKGKIIETNTAVLKKISDTETPPIAVAIGIQKKYNPEMLKNMQKVILLEEIKDAGNLGTIIRSAVAFGGDAIILYGDCVDIYNPKCVRSTVGNLWKVPIIHIQNLQDLDKYFSKYSKIATLPKANNYLKNFNLKTPALIMFGSEAEGLSKELINYSTDNIKIEMQDNVESLNLATSVSVIMYELFNK
jgi:TrmH family RNA methyltransferase